MNFVVYVVKVSVSYIKMQFEFQKVKEACAFMDMFLDHVKCEDDVKVYMERVSIFEEKEGE